MSECYVKNPFCFVMNGITYTIIEVDQEEFMKYKCKEDDGYYFGQTHFSTQEIWLDKNLNTNRKMKALYHELMHCYIKEYITTQELDNFDEEILCDISANAHEIIQNISEEYLKYIRNEH